MMRAARWALAAPAYLFGGWLLRAGDWLIAPYVQPAPDLTARIMAAVAQAAAERQALEDYLDAGRQANYGGWRCGVVSKRPAND